MSQLPDRMPPAVDIPESCLGCPMIAAAGELYQSSLDRQEAFITKQVNAAKERDQNDLENFFDTAVTGSKRTAEEAYGKTMDDIAAVTSIIELMPDSSDMTVPEFIRIYRTDENKLGDESIGKIYSILKEDQPDSEALVDELPVNEAVKMAANAVTMLKDDTEHSLLLSQEFIDNQVAATDTEQQYRTALDGKAEALYVEEVTTLLDNCAIGLIENRQGFRKRNVVSYCGSQAFRGGRK